eukprot:scaffold460665_cov18-Prasinocladus_malaysianus.AAC.1
MDGRGEGSPMYRQLLDGSPRQANSQNSVEVQNFKIGQLIMQGPQPIPYTKTIFDFEGSLAK